MSARVLAAITVPLALLSWGVVALFTAAVPPSLPAYAVLLPLAGLAVTMTAAVPVWLLAHAFHVPGTGERPAFALRAAAWIGVWAIICLALQLAGLPVWGAALALAVVLGLLETFLLQGRRAGK